MHVDDPALEIETEAMHEPKRQLTERKTVTHRQRAGADEALPPGTQAQTLYRATGGIGAIEYPHALAVRGGRFEHVTQGGDEGVDTTADVLQIHEHHVEAIHHRRGRAPHVAVQTEYRNAVHGIVVIPRPACRRAARAAGRRQPPP